MRFFALFAALFFTAPALADVTVGTQYDGGCYPFSCFTHDGGTTYQQVYSAGSFSGPVSISGLSFQDYYSSSSDMGDATLKIDFYLTSKNPFGLSSNLASNRGSLIGTLGTFNVAGPAPSPLLTINGNAFNYDPSWGNLLMQVSVLGFTRTACCGYWYTDAPEYLGGVTSAAVNGTYGYNNYNGLVTTFKTSAISAVPEPALWAMMVAGFGVVGGSLRRARIKPALA